MLIENQSYALHSLWKSIQQSPGKLYDVNGNVNYYIVVKYLKIDGKSMWIQNNLRDFFGSII